MVIRTAARAVRRMPPGQRVIESGTLQRPGALQWTMERGPVPVGVGASGRLQKFQQTERGGQIQLAEISWRRSAGLALAAMHRDHL